MSLEASAYTSDESPIAREELTRRALEGKWVVRFVETSLTPQSFRPSTAGFYPMEIMSMGGGLMILARLNIWAPSQADK